MLRVKKITTKEKLKRIETGIERSPEFLEKLANDLPENTICVAESGLYGSNDINKVIKMGYRAALIGTSLMQSADPQATLQKMKAAASKSI